MLVIGRIYFRQAFNERLSWQVQEEVRQLLCLLTRDNAKATEDLRALLMDRISLTLRGHAASSDLAFAVRHEMALLAALVSKEDSCWEQKLR
jgi:E3 ubiquitin-protein ligase UBR4